MFTGIVEELGKVAVFDQGRLSLNCSSVLSDLTLGASTMDALSHLPAGFDFTDMLHHRKRA